MSQNALNQEQFENHIHPHQLALPGMEEHAHPWAGPLSRSYMLDYQHRGYLHGDVHELRAMDVGRHDPNLLTWGRRPEEAAQLAWAGQGKTGHTDHPPGEVVNVSNWQRDPYEKGEGQDERAKGLAGALFHTAHHFNFGQDTVPIHSVTRSPHGKHFSDKVRPDLKPDVWHDYTKGRTQRDPDKPRGEDPKWPGITEPIHPFEKERKAKDAAVVAKMRARRPVAEQGRLF